MNDQQMRLACETVKKVRTKTKKKQKKTHYHQEMKERHDRMQQRLQEKQNEDFDEQEAERLEIENEKEEEVLSELAEVVGRMVKYHKVGFLRPFSEVLLAGVIAMLQPSRRTHERQVALCILDDVAEFAGAAALPLYKHFLPAMIQYTADPNGPVRQAAVYGVGVCAQFGGPTVAGLMPDLLQRLMGVIRKPDARVGPV